MIATCSSQLLGGMDVDLDHAGVGRHLDHVQPRVVGRRVAFDQHRQVELGRRVLDRGHELGELLGTLGRRHEDAELAVARLDRQRGPRPRPAAGVPLRASPAVRPAASRCSTGACAGRAACAANGSSGTTASRSSGGTQGREPSGRRKPTGESPGTRNSLPRRVSQRSLRQCDRPLRLPALDRQDVAGGDIEAALEHLGQPRALHRVVELVVGGVQVRRQRLLLGQEVVGVLVGRQRQLGVEAQPLGQAQHEALGMGQRGPGRLALGGRQRRVAPQGHAVAAPVERERPARQGLAGIPLALAVLQHAARREAGLQPADQVVGQAALGRPHRRRVPLGLVAVVDRDEGGLAADGQPDVARLQPRVDGVAGGQDLLPLGLVVGLGDARLLEDAPHAHLEAELDLARVDRAGDRCRAAGVGRAGQRQVALAGEQARGRVEPDPAGAGQIDLGPGVQVGEVLLGAGRPVQRLHVGLELDQVARDEAGGEAQMAQHLHQQPGGVPARAGAQRQRLLAGLDARLHADDVADLALQALVEADQEVDRAAPAPAARRRAGRPAAARAARIRDRGRGPS